MSSMKGVVVGDSNVGKSSFLITWTTREFPEDFIPTIYYDCTTNIEVNGSLVSVSIWDTGELEDYDRLRPMSYPQTDIFLLCFSVVKRTSFENIRYKWLPEVKNHCPHIPVVLVGMKTDLRVSDFCEDTLGTTRRRDAHVTTQEGELLAREIGACGYFETSSLYHTGIDEVMKAAIRFTMCTQCCQNTSIKRSYKFRWPFRHLFKKTAAVYSQGACNISAFSPELVSCEDTHKALGYYEGTEVDDKTEDKLEDREDRTRYGIRILEKLSLKSKVKS